MVEYKKITLKNIDSRYNEENTCNEMLNLTKEEKNLNLLWTSEKEYPVICRKVLKSRDNDNLFLVDTDHSIYNNKEDNIRHSGSRR